MEIEVGDYVRDKEGNITRIFNLLNLDREVYLYLGEDGYQYSDNAIKSHSKNTIDLIEVGDYVNGYRVEQVSIGTNEVLLDHNGFAWRTLKDGDKIVTHEQFSSIEYKVGENK